MGDANFLLMLAAVELLLFWVCAVSAVQDGSVLTLRHGVEMPSVGYGTAGRMNERSIALALDAGFQLLDSAQAPEWYDEDAAANAARGHSQVFVTSKIHARHHGRHSARTQARISIGKFDRLDALLLHHPVCWLPMCDPSKAEGTWLDSWASLEELHLAGEISSIGVCNVGVRDLKLLLAGAQVVPHIVQNWMDPLHQDTEVRQLCKQHKIQYQAYSTLGTQHSGRNPILNHPELKQIAAELDRSVAQVVLKWALQQGVAVLPRSTKHHHMKSNLQLFDWSLSDEHVRRVTQLSPPEQQQTDDQQLEVALQLPRGVVVDGPVRVEWLGADGGTQPVGQLSPAGGQLQLNTYKGHKFEGRTEDGVLVAEWQIWKGGMSSGRMVQRSDL